MNEIETAVRASDTERERVAKLISTAAGEGRLSIAEADERLERVYAAKFRHELAEFVADLPADAEPRPQRIPSRLRLHAAVAVVVSVLLVLRWVAMDVPFFWPAGPMFLLWGTFLLHARFAGVTPWVRRGTP